MIAHSADLGAARRASVPPAPVRGLLRLLSATAWTLLGAFAYVVCQGMFGGYPQVHSELLTTLGMIAIALTGGVAWIIDERRSHGDE
ncbi:hypothetical protein [Nonomuraea turcica]|uniref:hypothetical protein n=1 Tax=Nonomuraea sp. G32 TaxID=3067274 RepID=UPI00273C6767|nr:hypothetical protein [Nonomuraea sp. G32]MDP4504957.1 hypothetical protein [Nonomuraea sp. G32]